MTGTVVTEQSKSHRKFCTVLYCSSHLHVCERKPRAPEGNTHRGSMLKIHIKKDPDCSTRLNPGSFCCKTILIIISILFVRQGSCHQR